MFVFSMLHFKDSFYEHKMQPMDIKMRPMDMEMRHNVCKYSIHKGRRALFSKEFMDQYFSLYAKKKPYFFSKPLNHGFSKLSDKYKFFIFRPEKKSNPNECSNIYVFYREKNIKSIVFKEKRCLDCCLNNILIKTINKINLEGIDINYTYNENCKEFLLSNKTIAFFKKENIEIRIEKKYSPQYI
jgi:hypothetical protein